VTSWVIAAVVAVVVVGFALAWWLSGRAKAVGAHQDRDVLQRDALEHSQHSNTKAQGFPGGL
jgi:hypothetical protein